jgi:hypothetical protein
MQTIALLAMVVAATSAYPHIITIGAISEDDGITVPPSFASFSFWLKNRGLFAFVGNGSANVP